MYFRVVIFTFLWTTVSGQMGTNGCPSYPYNGNYWTLGLDNLCYIDPKTSALNYQNAGAFCYNTFGAYLPTVFDALANANIDKMAGDTETWLGLNSAHWNGAYEWDMPNTKNSTFNKFPDGRNPKTNEYVYMDADGSWKEEGDTVTRKVICSIPKDTMSCAGNYNKVYGMYNDNTRLCYRGSGIQQADVNSSINFCRAWKTCANLVKITSKEENFYVSKMVAWETVTGDPWVWIGLRLQNGQLVWSDGTPLGNGYSNLGGGNIADGSCVAMKMTQNARGDADAAGSWKLMPCNVPLRFVCQSNPYVCSN